MQLFVRPAADFSMFVGTRLLALSGTKWAMVGKFARSGKSQLSQRLSHCNRHVHVLIVADLSCFLSAQQCLL